MTCHRLLIVLGMLMLLPAPRSEAAPALQLSYASTLPGNQLQIDTTGLTLRARDADGTLRWTYQVQQATDGSDCSGELWLTPLLQDANADGRIDASQGERARLLLAVRWQSQGRSHSAVVALEASLPGPPQQLWRRDDEQLVALAELVTAPTAARLRIGQLNHDSAQWVLMLGAGLPRAATANHPARSGAQLLILDAQDGRTLWQAGGTSSTGTDQRFAALQHAVAATLTVLDTDHDGYADRLYVGDWNAVLWRFDFTAGASASRLAAGGILAQLADSAHPLSRGFLAAADVALLRSGSTQWFNVALGSVATGRAPAGAQALFVLRDRQPFAPLNQKQYDALPPLLAADLPVLDAGTSQSVSDTAPGWQLRLGSGQSITRALTLGGVLLFTQVLSPPALELLACRTKQPRVQVAVGALAAITGLPALDLNQDGHRDAQDLAVVMPQVDALQASLMPAPPTDNPSAPGCLLDGLTVPGCPAVPPPTLLYWRRDDAD